MASTRRINYPPTRASPVKPAKPPDAAKLTRDLRTVVRRHDARALALEEATAERDRVIRDAHAGGLTSKQIAAIVTEASTRQGLTAQRVDQIRRHSRL